ncbi:hypothetical protein ABL78_1896 [Leptomonas seymouri]|uniref:t-SNARE coiled-coil homology domain-containing protein n=1 Tax=Leptomonas seymouri TaxID=5684 RepID=A0A0N1PCQ6_LEPSE|nr:hypothetical protein ABL78_1896 [Leptomonas seymouri]|eukprot:KPI89012.1 hypothetical protein ABL78_1896 [Leptomonas seymouri]
MDLSGELWTLVESARQQQGSATPFTKSDIAQRLSISPEEQQTIAFLLSTSQTLSDAVANAISRASAHVHSVVVALDAATPNSTAHLQNSLLLSDAELLSVGSSLNSFTETLSKVSAVATARHKGKKRKLTKEAESRGNLLLAGLKMGDVEMGTGLAAHLLQAVRIQEQRVASKRLQVTLAKEELALYKSELFLYGRSGILSCSDAVVAQLTQSRSLEFPSPLPADIKSHPPLGSVEMRRHGPFSSSAAGAAAQQPSRSGFGTTFRVVDGMMQKAAQTVKAAGTHADSALQVAFTGGQVAARQLLGVGTSSVEGIVLMGAGADRRRSFASPAARIPSSLSTATSVGAIHLPHPAHDELTKEETARLEEQAQALLQLQDEASAQDAKAVEASIRELSQLTSLMSEQVVQQTEQFSILVRNTETAHTNVQKAVKEVEKPLRAFWNPTRQLIALLWACMVFLLSANWLAR